MQRAYVLPLIVLSVSLGASATAIQLDNLTPTAITSFSYSGAGTQANPLLINETVSSISAQGIKVGFRRESGDPLTLYVQKTVLNNSGRTWSSYENELGFQFLGGRIYGQNSVNFVGSNDGDGLSFDQGTPGRITSETPYLSGVYGPDGTFGSDKWTHVFLDETTNTRDFIQFFSLSAPGDVVNPGQSVTMIFRIVWGPNFGVNGDFILAQDFNVAVVPEPATLSVLGLAGLAALRRRKR